VSEDAVGREEVASDGSQKCWTASFLAVAVVEEGILLVRAPFPADKGDDPPLAPSMAAYNIEREFISILLAAFFSAP